MIKIENFIPSVSNIWILLLSCFLINYSIFMVQSILTGWSCKDRYTTNYGSHRDSFFSYNFESVKKENTE